MPTILVKIICLLIAGVIAFFPVGMMVFFLSWHIDHEYKKYQIYCDKTPIFKLNAGVIKIDWRTFVYSRMKRFIVCKFSKAIIILDSGKELYFHKGIPNNEFIYNGKFSIADLLNYRQIEKYI